MSPEAVENDKSLGCPLIPVEKVFLDHDFNCRNAFSPMQCTDLARDIGKRGLLQPITVRKLRPETKDGLRDEQELFKKGFEYIVIAGHRRLTAYKINKAGVIPSFIKEAYFSPFECKDLNAVENLHRAELSLMEEAQAIKHYWQAGWPVIETAERVEKSTGWVQIRYMLLEMPEEVQDLASSGHVKQNQVRELYKYRSRPKELLTLAAKVRDNAKSHDRKNIDNLIRHPDNSGTKKARSKTEVKEMMDHLRETFEGAGHKQIDVTSIITVQGNCLATEVLGWAFGYVSTGNVYSCIKRFCDAVGVKYVPPELELKLEV